MNSFNEPIQGTKIAEYKESFSNILLIIFAPILFGSLLFVTKFSPNWIDYIIYFVAAFGVISVFVKGMSFKYRRKLYYFADGLCIDENKIPFFQNGQKNIDFFILDDNRIFFKTNLIDYKDAIDGSVKKMGFKIEPQFQNHKQELLAFLNDKISN